MTQPLYTPTSGRLRTPPGPGIGPVAAFVPLALFFAAGAASLGAALGETALATGVSLAVFSGVAAVALRGLWRFYPHRALGLCNIVTLFRAALVAGLAAVLVDPGALAGTAAWPVVILAAVTLALDGLDGWLARSSGLVSDFGARFDMEVDALFALILAIAVWQSDKVGAWVLLLGTMRYLYVMASRVWPWLNAPLPEDVMRRKTVCVIQIATLVALLAPVIMPPVSVVLAAIATGLLIWSFAADIVWLHRRRAG